MPYLGTIHSAGQTILASDINAIQNALAYATSGVYNVKEYGAKGDGATDDTSAINAAITASLQYSLVLFPVGTYLISAPIVLKPDRTYCGYQATIKQKNGANMVGTGGPTTGLMVAQDWYSNVNTCDNPIQVLGFTLDVNKASNGSSTACGIILYNWRSLLRDLHVQNAALHGIYLASETQNQTQQVNNSGENRIEHCTIENSGGCGIYASNVGSSANSDGFCLNNNINTVGDCAIQLNKAGGWLISGNHTYGTTPNDGIRAYGSAWTRIANNIVERFGDANVASGYYAGIAVRANAEWGTIVNDNHVSCLEPAVNSSTYYYLLLTSNSSNNDARITCVGNDLTGAGTVHGLGIVISRNGAGYVQVVLHSNNQKNIVTPFYQDAACYCIDSQGGNRVTYAAAAPVSGGPYQVGDIVYNTIPAAAGNIGWVCTVAGSPGTWKSFGTIAA